MALLFFMISPTNMQFFHLLKHKDTDQHIVKELKPALSAMYSHQINYDKGPNSQTLYVPDSIHFTRISLAIQHIEEDYTGPSGHPPLC